jgi:two-component system LytT family response regulator
MSGPVRAFLVDDEPLALERLHRMLLDTGRVEIVGETSDPAHALVEISRLRPEAIFTDIEMPAVHGFELLSRLTYEPAVVFTTAYEKYAVRAFEVNSVDYLLKPIEPEALDRALRRIERGRVDGRTPLEHLRAVLDDIIAADGSRPRVQRIASRTGNRVRLIDARNVSHFTAEDKLTYAITDGGAEVVDPTLNDLEAQLDPRQFHRVHRSALVNLDFVAELHGSFEASFRVRLKDRQQTELKVSRDRVQQLKDKLGLGRSPKAGKP